MFGQTKIPMQQLKVIFNKRMVWNDRWFFTWLFHLGESPQMRELPACFTKRTT